MKQLYAPVVRNEHLTGDYWLLEIDAPSIIETFSPGQFVNIRVENNASAYLRRPFSVYRVLPEFGRLQVAYKLVGQGTRLMAATIRAGGVCDVVGPLGKGFRLPEEARAIAVIGRGIGVASLPTLVEAAAAARIEVYGFLSARTADNIVATDIFETHGCPVVIHDDEAWPGVKVTDFLPDLIKRVAIDAFYVCGSNRLMRDADTLARRLGVPAEVAMEQHMACGFGDCHGCVIQVNLDEDGREKAYREVCHYGPVFNTWEVVNA